MKVAIVVFEGFEELDALGPYAVFTYARDVGADVEVALVTAEPAQRVTAQHGLVVVPHGTLDDSYQLVVVPGGGWLDRGEVGLFAEAKRGVLPSAVARVHERGATVGSVCTGALLLAASGLLRGRPAVTHHGALAELAASGAEVIRERVVDDDDVVTAGGVTAGIDLSLWLVEREWGSELAEWIAQLMEHERVGGVWRRAREVPQIGAE
jgi:transcriptional regulator GlxA family with amidase domain